MLEIKFKEKIKMPEKLFSYPHPQENPNCMCDNPRDPATQDGLGAHRAFFCSTGHLTECHAGATCDEARCSHLPRYSDGEMDDYTIEDAPAFDVVVTAQKTISEPVGFSMLVYLPDEETVLQAMELWLSRTENLKDRTITYQIQRREVKNDAA